MQLRNKNSSLYYSHKSKLYNHCKVVIKQAYLSKHKSLNKLKYQCFHCVFNSSNKAKLEHHIKVMHSMLFKCNVCDLLGIKKHVMKHVKQVHSDILYPCKFSISWKKQLERFISEISVDAQTYRCRFCKLLGRSNELIDKHIQSVHSKEMENVCPSCDYFADSRACLKEHMKLVHNKENISTCLISNLHPKEIENQCSECYYHADSSSCLQKHKNDVHGNKNISLLRCVKTILALKQNIVKSNEFSDEKNDILEKPIDDGFSCLQCNFKTYSKAALKTHSVSIHHPKMQPLYCQICGFKAASKRSLNLHSISAHRSKKILQDKLLNTVDEKEKYFCSKCRFESKSKLLMQIHLNAGHSNKTLLFCSLERKIIGCDYKTTRRDLLNKHFIKMHKSEKLLFCPYCSYQTEVKADIKKHIDDKHPRENQFTCSLCDTKTNSKIKLKRHFLRAHSNDKYHSCSQCDFKSFIKVNISRHVNKVHC